MGMRLLGKYNHELRQYHPGLFNIRREWKRLARTDVGCYRCSRPLKRCNQVHGQRQTGNTGNLYDPSPQHTRVFLQHLQYINHTYVYYTYVCITTPVEHSSQIF
jgi:hypothetical protein